MRDAGWPCQRLRLAFGAFLFFLFEVFVGQKLPAPMPGMILAMAVLSFASAQLEMRRFKLRYQIELIMKAIEASEPAT
jgi:hypothetical protein